MHNLWKLVQLKSKRQEKGRAENYTGFSIVIINHYFYKVSSLGCYLEGCNFFFLLFLPLSSQLGHAFGLKVSQPLTRCRPRFESRVSPHPTPPSMIVLVAPNWNGVWHKGAHKSHWDRFFVAQGARNLGACIIIAQSCVIKSTLHLWLSNWNRN